MGLPVFWSLCVYHGLHGEAFLEHRRFGLRIGAFWGLTKSPLDTDIVGIIQVKYMETPREELHCVWST